MKKGIINIICFAGACLLALGTFIVYQNSQPITVDLPALQEEESVAQNAEKKGHVPAMAARARQKRWVSCETDDDCIIVDKDPCGCLSGPTGVEAINVNYVLEFDKSNQNKTVTCSDGEPSQEAQCSPDAHPVCQNKVCTIVF